MKRDTAIASGMKRAGIDTDAALLHSIAVDLLRKNGLAPRRVLHPFVAEVRDAGGIMAALIDRKTTEIAAIEYLQRIVRDMSAADLKVSARAGSGGKTAGASNGNRPFAPRDISTEVEGGGKRSSAGNGNPTRAPATVSGVKPDGEAIQHQPEKVTRPPPPQTLDGWMGNEAAASNGKPADALPSSSESAVRGATVLSPEKATSVAPPHGAPRSLADMKRIREVSPTIFDTRKLRDGTPIGDLRWSQLDRFATDNAQEAALLRLIKQHAVPADPNARIRDVVSLDTLQKFVQKSAEIAEWLR